MNEKTALIILAIALFAGGCWLGFMVNEQVLREIGLALPHMSMAVRLTTPYALLLSIGLAAGLFLATPTIAIALARPLIRSFLLRCIAAYLLSALISAAAAIAWFHWANTYARSTLTPEDIPIFSAVLVGPLVVLILAGVLSARYGGSLTGPGERQAVHSTQPK